MYVLTLYYILYMVHFCDNCDDNICNNAYLYTGRKQTLVHLSF